MADIDVVKKGSRMWLWIAIALAILIAMFVFLNRSADTRTGLLNDKGGQPFAAVSLTPHVPLWTA